MYVCVWKYEHINVCIQSMYVCIGTRAHSAYKMHINMHAEKERARERERTLMYV